MLIPELVLDAHADVGEGPVWDQTRHRLLWVDITRGVLHRFNPATGMDTALRVGPTLGCVALRERGGLLLGHGAGLVLLDEETERIEPLASVAADPTMWLNDGRCDTEGRFWVGSVHEDETTPCGALHRVDVTGSVTAVVPGTTMANGIGWSPDGRTMYFVDSVTHGIDAFAFDPRHGTIRDRRRLVTTDPDKGLPDGLAVDAEGFLWVAYWGGWCIRRFTPDGGVDHVVPLPVSQVSCPGFGGPDLRDLYVTTAAHGLTPSQLDEQPTAGGLYRLRTEVPGQPAPSYRG
ncbi:SMP-30/gluconolactonase/LRE family protein [Pseudonocardia acaciae]|uniref:SMP-30/gluconolactonase/LRE family protein n=1 Tax=Pseudonocardia acaciae TaxID=551276 RepID=UPI00146FEAB2|nr:SMP-30/gluconolactonase/LRE family protein [Pseudonocardia acaciae]